MPASRVVLYGIKNCDTVKKARAWLDEKGVAYAFHDFKTDGIDPKLLRRWSNEIGWEVLFNRAGTTFRKLSDAEKANINETTAMALMIAQPSLIKRPVLEANGRVRVGFKPEIYQETFC